MAGTLEPEYADAFSAWKAQPSPATVGPLLQAVDPLLRQAAKHYSGDHPVSHGDARRLFLSAIPRYDPKRVKLSTFVYSQLQGMRRDDRRAGRGVRVSDQTAADRYGLEQARRSFADEQGREPTDDELMDHAGVNPKRYARALRYQPAVAQGSLDAAAGGSGLGGYDAGEIRPHPGVALMHHLVYAGLPSLDQQVMALTLGMHGRPPLSNLEVARTLKLSAGAISQRKAKIQTALDRAQGLE